MSEGLVKVIFKVPPSMLDRLEQEARAQGKKRAEYIREALRLRFSDGEVSP